MLQSPVKSVIARSAILALVLALAISFVTVGLAPSASAQEAEADPCAMDEMTVTCSYDENSMDPVADFSALDPEQEGIDWSIEGHGDEAFFDITGGVLTFKKSPNFEMPADVMRDDDDDTDVDEEEAAGNNRYLVTIRASEMLAAGQAPPAKSSMLYVIVNVEDVDEPGMITLNRIQPQAGATLTATLSDPDQGAANTTAPDSLVWMWEVPKVSRPDPMNNAHWTTAGGQTATDTGLMSAYIPDADSATDNDDGADNGKVLRVMVTYNDEEGDGKKAYMLSYRAVRAAPALNQAPSFDDTADFGAMVPEDTAVGTAVGIPVTASDPNDGDTLSYELGGDDDEFFNIDIATGQITIAMKLDHERDETDGDDYDITVTAYDPNNTASPDPAGVTITATDVNEAPTVEVSTGNTPTDEFDENASVDPAESGTDESILGRYMAADVDDGNEPKLTLEGDDADAFELTDTGEEQDTAGDGNFELRFADSPNYEMPTDANMDAVYKVTIVATDEKDLTGTRELTIKVNNVDEAGTVTFSTIQPAVGEPITAMLSDKDGGENDLEWQWASSETGAADSFTDIDDATSATYTPKAPVLDNPATVGINEMDRGDEGKYLRARVTYRDAQSEDDDEDTADVEEGRRGIDDTDTVDVDERVFEDTENAVRARPDVNNPPMFDSATMMRSVDENEKKNAGDPVMADDPDDDSLTYSITGGADMDAFGIVPESGQLTVKEGTDLNAEGTQTTYEVEVTASDPFDGRDSTMVTLTVMNVNEAPEFMAEDPDGYDENGMGPVAMFSAADPEMADVEWALEGHGDEAFFNIDDNGVLTFKNPPNYEMPLDVERPAVTADPNADPPVIGVTLEAAGDNDYVLTVRAAEVRAADAMGTTMSTALEITVTVKNIDEPASLELTRVQPQVSAAIGTEFSDPDGDDEDSSNPVDAAEITWAWEVPKVSRPDITKDSHWTAGSGTNGTTATYTPGADDIGDILRVKASYEDGEGADKVAYMLSYNTVRGAPTANQDPVFDDNADDTRSIAEDAPKGAVVGAPVTATDPNADDGSKLTYTLAGDDAGSFKINKMTGQITVNAELDHEDGAVSEDGVYDVAVNVFDPSNATDTFDVDITATNVNENPKVIVDPNNTTEMMMVSENHEVMDEPDAIPAVVSVVLGTYVPMDEDVEDGSGDPLVANASQVKLTLEGDDMSAFKLDSDDGQLRFKDSPDYEMATDANGDSVYKVTIVATDKKGLRGTKELSIEVRNIDESGDVTLSTIQPAVGEPITAMVTDKDGGVNNVTYQWASSGTQGGSFTDIDGATSMTYTPIKTILDNPATEDNEGVTGDEGNFLRVRVTYRDDQSMDDDEDTENYEEGRRGIVDPGRQVGDDPTVGEAIVEEISENAVREEPEVNNPPVFAEGITRTVDENTEYPGKVGDEAVTADDADGDVLRYTIIGGPDMDAFDIDRDSGQLKVGMGTMLDYESGKTTYMVEVKAEDPFGKSDSTTVTIMVQNVNEPPDLMLVVEEEPVIPPVVTPTISVTGDATAGYEENGTEAVRTYTSSAVDATWSLSGEDVDDFSISEDGVLSFASSPDFEAPTDANTDNVYMVTVTAMAEGATDGMLEVAVTVTDVDEEEPPVNGAFDALAAYDADGNGAIDRPEVITAIRDYFADMIDRDAVIAVIRAYFGN